MKLIIDIDEQHFEILQSAVRNGMGDNSQKIIANGTPLDDILDKIREEINGLIKYYPYPVVSPYQTNNYAMLMEDEVLHIIDKYRERSE